MTANTAPVELSVRSKRVCPKRRERRLEAGECAGRDERAEREPPQVTPHIRD